MSPDTSRMQMLVDKVQGFLGGWLEQKLKAIHPKEYWQKAVLVALDDRQRKIVREDGSSCPQELDLPMQVSVFRYNWPSLLETFHLNRQVYNDAVAIKQIRNKYDHKKRNVVVEWERYCHDMETVYLFLKELKAEEKLLDEVREVMSESVPFGRRASLSIPVQSTFKIAVSPHPQLVRHIATVRTNESHNPSPVTSKAESDLTSTISTQKLPMRTSDQCDVSHVNECKRYLNMALEIFPQYFDSSSFIVSSVNRESSPIQGKGVWDYLVLLHCKSYYQEACKSINAFYPCTDTTPYVQGEYIVWQFPRYVEQSLDDGNVAGIYPVGTLPSMFDDLISSKAGTSYCPDFRRVQHNDDAGRDDALWYLGNYFPKSFAEAFCIFDFAFSHALEAILGGRKELAICDVGAGSGGATLGLIWALRKYLAGNGAFERIRLYGFDVNRHALNLFSEMLQLMKREWPIGFDVVLHNATYWLCS